MKSPVVTRQHAPSTKGTWRYCGLAMLTALMLACDPGIEPEPDTDDPDDPDSPPATTDAFVGASPYWELALEDDQFDLDLRARPGATVDATADGEFERLTSGFSRFTVRSSTGTTAPVAEAQLAALGVEEDLLFARDWRGERDVLPLIPGPTCPTGTFKGNWIQWRAAAGESAAAVDTGFFGTVSYSSASEELFVDESYALTAEFPETVVDGDPFIEQNCENGVVDDDSSRLFFGRRGTAILQAEAETSAENLWLVLPRDDLTSAVLDGDYVGFWTDNTRNGVEHTWYVTASCTDGSCPVQRINDIGALNSTANDRFQINLEVDEPNEPSTGFVTGNVITASTLETYAGNIACAATEDFNGTGTKVLACVGQSPSNNTAMVKGIFIAEE